VPEEMEDAERPEGGGAGAGTLREQGWMKRHWRCAVRAMAREAESGRRPWYWRENRWTWNFGE